mmetsp:Transcript_99107/g.289170  ORF Transcript_99107/g.289170 Transcript_99107/m.289170 type:complete len:280 (+) Transcript_99107:521-1360(+)
MNSVRSSSSHHSKEAWRKRSQRAWRSSALQFTLRSFDRFVITAAELFQIGRHMRSCPRDTPTLTSSSNACKCAVHRACAADLARNPSSSVIDSYSRAQVDGVVILCTMCSIDFSSDSGRVSTRSARQWSLRNTRSAGACPSTLRGRPVGSCAGRASGGDVAGSLAAAVFSSGGPPASPPSASCFDNSKASRNCASSIRCDAAPRASSDSADATATATSLAANAAASAASSVGVTLNVPEVAAEGELPAAPSEPIDCSESLKCALIISRCALLCHFCTVS